MRGVYAIPPTPFTQSGAVDEDSLDALIAFCLECGVHGIVTPVIASEAAYLTAAERMALVEQVVGNVAGRVPVVVGVSADTEETSESLARHAARIGADAVIAMPPAGFEVGKVFAFYRSLAAAAGGLPVCIQHYPPPVGTVMSADLILSLVAHIPEVTCLKEESLSALPLMREVSTRAGDALSGLLGGYGGRAMIDEFQRGATGTMPACEFADVHVRIWNLLEAGEVAAARELHRRLLPLLVYESTYLFTWWKAVLVRRGVIATAVTRVPGALPVDSDAMREMETMLEIVEPYFVRPLPAPSP